MRYGLSLRPIQYRNECAAISATLSLLQVWREKTSLLKDLASSAIRYYMSERVAYSIDLKSRSIFMRATKFHTLSVMKLRANSL